MTMAHAAKFVLGDGHLIVSIRDATGASLLGPRAQESAVRVEYLGPDGTVLGALSFASVTELFNANTAHAEADPIQVDVEED